MDLVDSSAAVTDAAEAETIVTSTVAAALSQTMMSAGMPVGGLLVGGQYSCLYNLRMAVIYGHLEKQGDRMIL